MTDFRDKLKFAAARAAGASRSSAALRGAGERVVGPLEHDSAAPGSEGNDATVTLAMIQDGTDGLQATPDSF